MTMQAPPVLFAESDQTAGGRRRRHSHTLAEALALLGAGLSTRVTIPADGSPLHRAEHTTASIDAALAAHAVETSAALAEHVPHITAAISRIETANPYQRSPQQIADYLTSRIERSLSGQRTDLRTAAINQVAMWQQTGAPENALRTVVDDALSGASWQAKRAVITEVQDAYIEDSRHEFQRRGVRKVERIAQASACPLCAEAAGVYEAGDPDLYWSHPNCECDWEDADPGAQVDFARGPAFVLSGGTR